MNHQEVHAKLNSLTKNHIVISLIQMHDGQWGGLLGINQAIVFECKPSFESHFDVMAQIFGFMLENGFSEKLEGRESHGN